MNAVIVDVVIWLAFALVFFSMAAIDIWTFRTINHLSSRRPWRGIALGSLTIGIPIGVWFGCALTYQVAPDMRYIGFPVPFIVLQLENDRWVDYVGLIPVIVPFNVFTIASWFLMPVSLGLVLRRLSVGSSPRPLGC